MWRIPTFVWLLLVQDVLAVDLIAHRGFTCRAVENTSGAVTDAWLANADGVELDLRVSNDGVILVYHDEKVGRRLISDMSYDEIANITKPVAPTFRSILDLGRPDGYFVLDLKEADSGRYRSLAQIIRESGVDSRQILLQSQSIEVLTSVREAMPDAAYFYLTHLERKFPFFKTPGAGEVLARIKGADLDGVSLKGRKSIDLKYIERIKGAGYRVYVWTINDPGRAVHYRGIGVDGLITDTLALFRAVLEPGRETVSPCFGDGTDAS